MGDLRNVLIVEDNEDIRDVLTLSLEMEGYIVYSAFDGWHGLLTLSLMPRPSVILLDLAMPIMSGWDFIDVVCLDPIFTSIPIVALSANGDSLDQLSHVERVIEKPFSMDSVKEVVKSYCS